MKHLVLMCLLLHIHTSQSEIHHRGITEGAGVSIYCKHEGKVTWSKDRDGNRPTILTAESKDEIQKYIADPHNRYSVTDDLSLYIKNVSVSDSGIYNCNGNPAVNLTVTESDLSTTSPRSSTKTETITITNDKPNTSSKSPLGTTTPPSTDKPNTSSKSPLGTTTPPSTDKPNTSSKSPPGATTPPSTDKPNTSSESPPGATTPSSTESKIAAGVSGAVVFVFVVLVLLLCACIKRKDISPALSNKENIYESVDDSDLTAQPVPPQNPNPNDPIYYLAGDPDIVRVGQMKETDDHTYSLTSQSKENMTEREEDVPLYSTINVHTINQP